MTAFAYLIGMITARHEGISAAEASKLKRLKMELPTLHHELLMLQQVEAKWHNPETLRDDQRAVYEWVCELAAIYRYWLAECPSKMWDNAAHQERMAALLRRDEALKRNDQKALKETMR